MKHLPSVEKIVSDPSLHAFDKKLKREVRVRIVREVIENHRENKSSDATSESILSEVKNYFESFLSSGLRRAVNGTGIVLHTNLGRAPLGKSALARMAEELAGYCTLEIDTATGERGGRGAGLERWLKLLTGAEDALVVNNNAAAVWLVLFAVAKGAGVLISRGELVQIGGGFKVPDVMEAAGAHLVEVGTTNMTSLQDYDRNFKSDSRAVLKVHQSNFVVSGHTQTVSQTELAKWAQSKGIPFIVDLGSGQIDHKSPLPEEPNVRQALHQGASLVCFSGDKLFGGPQAGIIVGAKKWVSLVRASPLYRALRLGKTELFLLETAVREQIEEKRSVVSILLGSSGDEIAARAEQLRAGLSFLSGVTVKDGEGSVGGGAAPGEELPTKIVDIPLDDPQRWNLFLLGLTPSIVCRKNSKSLQLDPRTIFDEEVSLVIESFRGAKQCLS